MEPRDMVGYGKNPPRIHWPNGERIAVCISVAYEEGSERSLAYGDETRETHGEMKSNKPLDSRSYQTEAQWEYGGRAGIWRVLRILEKHQIQATFSVCGMALEQNPQVGPEIIAQGHDVIGHGYRWIAQWQMEREEEKAYIHKAWTSIEAAAGRRPYGWSTKGGRSENTRDLLAEEGFFYDCDSTSDDLPYYGKANGKPQLIVPHAFDANDGKYWNQGWQHGGQFFQYTQDAFDILYEEGETTPKMLSIGLHSRVSGRPGRIAAVSRFIEYAKKRGGVWFTGREQLARYWLENYPPAQ